MRFVFSRIHHSIIYVCDSCEGACHRWHPQAFLPQYGVEPLSAELPFCWPAWGMAYPDTGTKPQSLSYQRRRPEETLLYKVVQEFLISFYEQVERELPEGEGLPKFAKREFDEFLKCGILAHGFLRAQCKECRHERLVAFSFKRRGFCPSCGASRMAESAAHLVDEVLPLKPIRQWVLTFPYHLRLLLAMNPTVMGEVLGIFHRALNTYQCKKSGLIAGYLRPKTQSETQKGKFHRVKQEKWPFQVGNIPKNS